MAHQNCAGSRPSGYVSASRLPRRLCCLHVLDRVPYLPRKLVEREGLGQDLHAGIEHRAAADSSIVSIARLSAKSRPGQRRTAYPLDWIGRLRAPFKTYLSAC